MEETVLTKESIIEVLLQTLKDIQEDCEGEEEVLITSKPSGDFEKIDSHILLQVTGILSEELDIDIPKKCQLFLGKNSEQLTVAEVAEKLLTLKLTNGR